jgi:hypothetical protein
MDPKISAKFSYFCISLIEPSPNWFQISDPALIIFEFFGVKFFLTKKRFFNNGLYSSVDTTHVDDGFLLERECVCMYVSE